MLLTADWVLPISAAPIREGAVRLHASRITDVGTAIELAASFPREESRDFPGCALMPALVNAHTHLALTAAGGLLPPMPFADWLPRLVAATREWGPDDYAASATLGARRCLEAGVSVVGDIAYGPESLAAASDAGLGGVSYWEVLGISKAQLPGRLVEAEFPSAGQTCGPRMLCGLSPHALYTSGPELLRAMHDFAMERGLPFALHVAESPAEVQLVHDGTGPLADVAGRVAKGFSATGTGPIEYLDALGVLEGMTAVHVCQTRPSDVARIAATVQGVVTCPRSNAYLSTGSAPVARLLRAGVAVGVGTDSAASNEDLDLMAEVRALAEQVRTLDAGTLLSIATLLGARALGVERDFGSLEPAKQADIAAFRVAAETDDIEAALVQSAGRATLVALMSGGSWRVLEGRSVGLRSAEAAADEARERARAALEAE